MTKIQIRPCHCFVTETEANGIRRDEMDGLRGGAKVLVDRYESKSDRTDRSEVAIAQRPTRAPWW